MTPCPHCAKGSKPSWQAHSCEWVHRLGPNKDTPLLQVDLCIAPLPAPDGGVVRTPQLRTVVS